MAARGFDGRFDGRSWKPTVQCLSPVYTYLESPCNPSLPLVSALKQTFLDAILAFHDIQIVEQITEFESHLKQRLEEEMTAIVLSYEERINSHMQEGSCCRTLIHGSKFFSSVCIYPGGTERDNDDSEDRADAPGGHPEGIRCRGSVSASGDLIPLAYIAGLLIGNPQVRARIGVHGEEQEVSAPEALEKAGLKPFKLQAKEGLALVNGTSFATALAATVMYDANVLLLLVEMLCGMFCEVIFGREEFAHPLIHEMKPHTGQIQSAAHLEWLLRDSPFQELSREYYSINSLKKPKQDRYALRLMPYPHIRIFCKS